LPPSRRGRAGTLKLIRELARFEKLEHEMKATVTSLRKALFGPQPVAGALLAALRRKAPATRSIFTFSSFVGVPGLWLKTCMCVPISPARNRPSSDPGRRRVPPGETAAGLNGRR